MINIEFYVGAIYNVKDIDKLNLNYNTDFYDSGHLSITGSQKISLDIVNTINNMEVQND